MKGTNFGEFEELVLLVAAMLFDNAYGVAIQQEIENKCNRRVTISTVHSGLHRLEDKGYLSSRYGESLPERGGKRKLLFRVTSQGKSVLIQAKNMRNDLWNSIPAIAFDGGN